MSIKSLTDETFVEGTKEGLVIAELGAPWCGPCKMILPVLEEIAVEENELNIVQLDVDESPKTAQKYDVMSIPTILFFKDGKLVDKTMGFQSKEKILAVAQRHA